MVRTKFDELKFREECIYKEQELRLAWYRKRQLVPIEGIDKLPGASAILRRKIAADRELFSQSAIPIQFEKSKVKDYRMRKPTIEQECAAQMEKLKSMQGEVEEFKPMYPPPTKIKNLLYDGISREQKGRSLYLRKRCEQDPESRFPYPVTSSMEYGWNIIDLANRFDIKKPINGRRCIIRDTFYRRNGIPNPAKD